MRLLFILILFLQVSLSGQQRPGYPGNSRNSNSTLQIEQTSEDTVILRYITLNNIKKEYKYKDTTLQDFEKYAANRRFDSAALSLGNLGSSQRLVKYSQPRDLWRRSGFAQYDNHKLHLDDFKFYILGKSYNDLFFSPLQGQQNFKVKAKFSNLYANDLNLSLDLDRENQEGFYEGQQTKSTRFGAGIWKRYKEKKHELFIVLLANNHNEGHNGGITEPTTGAFINRMSDPVFLSAADGRHQNFSYSIDNFRKLKGEKFQVHHQIVFNHGYYRYSDEITSTSNDSTIYQSFIKDPRGIRYLLHFNKWKNTFDLSFNTKGIDLTLGLAHQYSAFRRDEGTLRLNEILAIAKAKFDFGQYVNLDALGELGLGSNAGNFRFLGDLNFQLSDKLFLSGNLSLMRYDPAMNEQNFSVSEIPVYDNSFSKINEFSLSGKLHIDFLRLTLGFNSGVIDQPIYFTSTALPEQKEGSTEYVQASLEHRFFWKFIGIENQVQYQSFTDNIYGLPEVYSIHKAYIQMPLFNNNLLAQVGGLYYHLDMSTQLGFHPVNGSFYATEDDFSPYPYYELFANFKIQNFKLFVKMENVDFRFIPIQHYQIKNYPQFDSYLRMGVNWLIRE